MLAASGLALALAGCAGVDYGDYLARWTGASEARLAADWGPPDWRNPLAGGAAELHYIYEDRAFELIGSADGDRFVQHCLTTFRVAPGPRGRPSVRSWRYSGNFCVPPPPGVTPDRRDPTRNR